MQKFYLDTFQTWLLNHGIKILVVLIIILVISKVSEHFIEKGIRKAVKGKPGLSPTAEKKREDTLIRIINGIAKGALWIFGGLTIVSEAGVDIGPLIAGAGVIGIAIGFGGQYLIKDLISGLFIILENQYRIGDTVTIAGHSGKVEDISLRVTVLRDLDGVVHHIPHGEITSVSNMTKGISKINLNLGVGYDTDLNKLKELINKIGKELAEDNEFKDLIEEAPKFLRVEDLADSAVVVKIVGQVEPGEQWSITGELRKRLKEACDMEGIEIPFPQVVVHQSKN